MVDIDAVSPSVVGKSHAREQKHYFSVPTKQYYLHAKPDTKQSEKKKDPQGNKPWRQ